MKKIPLIVAASLGTFVFGIIMTFYGQVVEPALGKTVGGVATMVLVRSIGLVIGSILAGPVIDRLGNKLAMVVGMGLVGVGALGLGHIASVASGCLMAMLIGMGGSAIVTGANAVIPDIAHTDAARGNWGNIINNFFGLGAFMSGIAFGVMMKRNASITQLATYFGAIGVAACLYYVVVKFPPPKAAGVGLTAGAGPILKRGVFWALAASLFFYAGCEVSVWQWLPKYLTETVKADPAAAGVTISIFALGIIAGRVVASVLLANSVVGPLSLTLIASAGIAVSFTGMLFSEQMAVIRVLAAIAGACMGPLFPTLMAVTGINFTENTGTAIGLALTGAWLGNVFIPPAVGYMLDWHLVADVRSGLFLVSAAAVMLVLVNVMAVVLSRKPAAKTAAAGNS
jgi:FHS family L-fucose permease-like MFS transporter